MSDNPVKSPFAIIAELASVTIVGFYLYAYFFFQGFMSNIDRKFLVMFSLRDIVDYLPSSLPIILIETTPYALIIGMLTHYPIINKPRFYYYLIVVPVLMAITALFAGAGTEWESPLLIQKPAVLIGGLLANAFQWIDPAIKVSGAEVDRSIALALWFGVAFSMLLRSLQSSGAASNERQLTRFVGYLLFLTGIAAGSGVGGYRFSHTLRSQPASYCVLSDTSRTSARLLIASDQNALFETDLGELQAIPFNAIKSIKDKPCEAK